MYYDYANKNNFTETTSKATWQNAQQTKLLNRLRMLPAMRIVNCSRPVWPALCMNYWMSTV